MPRWWRRKRRQEKAAPPKDVAGPSKPPSQNRRPADSAPTRGDAEPQSDAEPAAGVEPATGSEPAVDAESPRPLQPVPPPDPPSPAESDPPPAAAQAGDEGPDPEEAPRAAGPGPDAEEADDGSADLSSLADKVQAVLVAAESTAERIRRDAEADSARVAEERARQRHAARELIHLERLADSLSVQAESVKRQCAVVRELLPAVENEAAEPSTVPDGAIDVPESDEPGGEPRVRDLRGEAEAAAGREGVPVDPQDNGREFPHISRERVEAYRMKLAGACRTDVEAYLAAAGVVEASDIAAELFDPLAPARSAK